MFNTKRKRAVVLALIAFFCGATAYVAVDWKRFGGGFLAMFQHKADTGVASAGAGSSPRGPAQVALADPQPNPAAPPKLTVPASHRHTSGVGGGSGSPKSDDDLFKYGDPAAGGLAPGSFVVAQNDTSGAGTPASLGVAAAAETSAGETPGGVSGGEGGGVTSPAPAPGIGSLNPGDGSVAVKTPAPSPSTTPAPSPTPVASTPPAVTPPAPAQSGTSDQNPGDGGTGLGGNSDGDTGLGGNGNGGTGTGTGDGGNGGGTPPPASAIPEASNAAMMGLGALFLAVAAARKRKNG